MCPTSDQNDVYIIAELSANHGGSIEHAKKTIQAMKESGADAVKLQTYTAETLTIDCDKPDFMIGEGTIWEGKNLYSLYQEAFTPWEWQPDLFRFAEELGMDCFSTPFDNSSVDFLEPLNPPYYKIASFEMVDLPLIEYVASKGRPIIMSTGMANYAEIEDAVKTVVKAGVSLTLLKCTSAYPSPPEAMNLLTIPHLSESFGVRVGLSDHTLGSDVAIAAVALGARVIEKHFTLSRDDPGPDSAFSMEPQEFKSMVDSVRNVQKALGQINYAPTDKEEASKVFRRSLYVVADIAEGEEFTDQNLRSIRPGYGIAPKYYSDVLGKKTTRDLSRGTALQESDIAGFVLR